MTFSANLGNLARIRHAVLIVILMISGIAGLRAIGVTEAFDRVLWELRFEASSRPLSDELVFIDIDARSLEDLGVWPLPRRLFADLIDRLSSAGAREIVLDVDFSAASNSEDDRLMTEALVRAGNVALASFQQAASMDQQADNKVINQPIERFSNAAWPVVVMVPVETDSRIWRNLYGYPLGGSDELSAAAYLGEYPGQPVGSFWLDYSISIDELKKFSFVDVVAGNQNLDVVRDKKVIVGASAQELRDLFPAPVHKLLPGAVIQALGAETLLQDRALQVKGEWSAVLAGVGIFLLLVMSRLDGLVLKFAVLALAALTLETGSFLLLQRMPILVSSASAQIFLIGAAIVVVLRELGVQRILSHLSQVGRRNSERMLGQVFDDSFDAIVVIDRDARISAASRTARTLFGVTQLSGNSARDLLPRELVEEAINTLTNVEGSEPQTQTLRTVGKDGRLQYIEYVVTRSEKLVASEDGPRKHERQALACLTCRDVTEERKALERLAYLAKYDPVTELPNRNGLEDRLAIRLQATNQQNQRLCLVQFSISNLDQIRASLGYSYGDRVRQAIATRLKSHFNQDTVWASLNADVFAGVFLIAPGDEQTPSVITAVQQVIGEDYMIEGARISVRLDFGYIVDTGLTVETLLKKSGVALAKTRRNERVSVLAFHSEMDDALQRRRLLETELFKAVVRDELYMVYQPMVDLNTEAVVAAEALLRWDHRTLGEISPAEFVPIAEENGYIVELGAWALNRAMKEAAIWQRPLRLSINMSAMQFTRGDIVSTIGEALERSAFPAERLELEITESLFIDASLDLKTSMERIRDLGCRFSLDDFGTGYSSLGYIPKYPFSKIKLDRSFVKGLMTSKKDIALIQAVLDIAQAHDMETVVEGIEMPAQAEVLNGLGCRIGQGYLYGRPVTASEFYSQIKAAA